VHDRVAVASREESPRLQSTDPMTTFHDNTLDFKQIELVIISTHRQGVMTSHKSSPDEVEEKEVEGRRGPAVEG